MGLKTIEGDIPAFDSTPNLQYPYHGSKPVATGFLGGKPAGTRFKPRTPSVNPCTLDGVCDACAFRTVHIWHTAHRRCNSPGVYSTSQALQRDAAGAHTFIAWNKPLYPSGNVMKTTRPFPMRPLALLLALSAVTPAQVFAWIPSGVQTVTAHTQDKQAIVIGTVDFRPQTDSSSIFAFTMNHANFTDYFCP